MSKLTRGSKATAQQYRFAGDANGLVRMKVHVSEVGIRDSQLGPYMQASVGIPGHPSITVILGIEEAVDAGIVVRRA